MQIASDIWIEGPYYVEIDVHGQLCIVGPANHLHFGSVGLSQNDYAIQRVSLVDGDKLEVELEILHEQWTWHQPAIGHIRKVRELVELPGRPKPTFEEIYKTYPAELAPNAVDSRKTPKGWEASYHRQFREDWYGVTVSFPETVTVTERGSRLELHADSGRIPMIIRADSSARIRPGIGRVLQSPTLGLTEVPGGTKTLQLLGRSAAEVEHLVQYDKTSGFDYGTIFPRDWMESADLGSDDLTAEAVHYMYRRSLEHVDLAGEGWHEDIIGEFLAEKEQEIGRVTASMEDLLDKTHHLSGPMRAAVEQSRRHLVVRNMIDIEPHYIFGLERVEAKLWSKDDRERLQRVADYVVRQAEANRLITFKQMPPELHRTAAPQYYGAGNWRDSEQGYQNIHPVIAPYDVNVVFYPEALRIIAGERKLFGETAAKAAALQEKWDGVREMFRFSRNGSSSYALALYDVRDHAGALTYEQLAVDHLDEAYDHFYGQPSDEDTASFAKRLMDPEYFYTPSGPTLVGADQGFTTLQYHGRVIWTKQSAFAVAGLHRTYQRLCQEGKDELAGLVQEALIKTAEASLNAYHTLGVVPELHYDHGGTPHFYSDQPLAEGPMNKVQLWSAVGARRIIRLYAEILAQSSTLLS